MTGPSKSSWLAAIKSHFGDQYYNELIESLLEENGSKHWIYKLNEHHIYGSSRLGIVERNLLLAEEILHTDSVSYYSYMVDSIKYQYRGMKRYELSNHLGNVLAVITDRRIQSCVNDNVYYYAAQVVSITDYDPFGMEFKDRTYSVTFYRHGFNGKEKDDEVSGAGNCIAFEARIYDSRLGRFFSGDPLEAEYPWQSTYVFAHNSPISLLDWMGMGDPPAEEAKSSNTKTHVVVEGDYVWKIAKSQLGPDASNKQIANLQNLIIKTNNLNATGDVVIGQKLSIPEIGSQNAPTSNGFVGPRLPDGSTSTGGGTQQAGNASESLPQPYFDFTTPIEYENFNIKTETFNRNGIATAGRQVAVPFKGRFHWQASGQVQGNGNLLVTVTATTTFSTINTIIPVSSFTISTEDAKATHTMLFNAYSMPKDNWTTATSSYSFTLTPGTVKEKMSISFFGNWTHMTSSGAGFPARWIQTDAYPIYSVPKVKFK